MVAERECQPCIETTAVDSLGFRMLFCQKTPWPLPISVAGKVPAHLVTTDAGIIEPDRITVVDGAGQWKILDRQLTPLKNPDFSPAVFEALQQFRQFYEK